MLAAYYPTKRALKAAQAAGEALRYGETSFFGSEYQPNGVNYVVGPSEYQRKWYARVTCRDGKIARVE